ncbi:hypothetical protein DFQ27_009216 [Actinomortierella ambigua]|uniref:Peptidase M20 dimerisation domain-containing protein n=1 Tax=Actinomortierella ambigua TaxID=1343610 RepID=A0A9P6PPK1_9FUNG|nr:hypothetical protein DFQ27_009216 [Actinomortierella ambigua]
MSSSSSSEKNPGQTGESNKPTTPGCIDIFKSLFISQPAHSTCACSSSLEDSQWHEKAPLTNNSNSNTDMSPPHVHPVSNEEMAEVLKKAQIDPSAWSDDEYLRVISNAIDAASTELRSLSLRIHEDPELAYHEFKAHGWLTEYLQGKGFTVERSAYGLETAFVASSGQSKSAGGLVTVGICSEYDALPGIGHACGHNLIAISGVAAALGLKAVIEKFHLKAEVKLFGTPAEETSGGKITMSANGAFKGVDVCMMLHGANADVIYTPFLSLDTCEVEFFGKASHASASPWEGVNALDAAMQVYTNIAMMRQQIKPNQRVHGIIVEGGKAANIIPDYTKSVYTVRSPKWDEVVVLKKRVEAIFNGAAAATGCKVALKWGVPYKDIITNNPLAESFIHYMGTMGLKYASKEEQQSKLSGSTDFGNLSYEMPGIHPMFNILNLDGIDDRRMGLHSTDFAGAASKPVAHIATMRASKALARTGIECIVRPEFLKQVKEDFENQTHA